VEGLADILPVEAWRRLQASGTRRVFMAGQRLLHQGDRAEHVLLLTSGHVKVSRVDVDGNTLVLAIRGPGEVLGEIGLLGGDARSATVTALETCETRVVGASEFVSLVRSLGLEGELLRHVIQRLREGEEMRAELSALPAKVRVARCLLRWAAPVSRSGPRPTDRGPDVLDVAMTQEELAQAVGLHRSTVANELRRLREDAVLATARNRIVILDVIELRKRANA
jgi:CRP/FNR family cyclic AMP-dependent transcriptional regulator